MLEPTQLQLTILSTITFDKESLYDCIGSIKAEYFDPPFDLYFKALQDLTDKQLAFTVNNLQMSCPQLPYELLEQVTSHEPSSYSMVEYKKELKLHYARRQRIKGYELAVKKLKDISVDSTLALKEADKIVYDFSIDGFSKSSITLQEIIQQYLDKVDANEDFEDDKAISTPFQKLNFVFGGGFKNGRLYVVAARQKMGKTSFMMDIARHAAIKKNYHVVIFSLEMSVVDLAKRVLASEVQVPNDKIFQNKYEDKVVGKLTSDSDLYELSRNIHFDLLEDDEITATALFNKCKAYKAKGELDLLIVDYLQLIERENKNDQEYQTISHATRVLKKMSRRLNIPILVASQFSREVNKEKRRPMLADLKGSGTIESDADVVFFLYKKEEEDEEVEVIIAANRHGAVGSTKVKFIPEFTTFQDIKE